MMRQSPLLIVYKGLSLARNALFFYLLLFVAKKDSTATFIEFGRNAFWLLLSLSMLYILVDWWQTTFQLNEHHLTKGSGIFVRKTQQIPVSQLEQATVKRNWFHRLTKTVAYTYQLADANEQLTISMIDERKMNLFQATPIYRGDVIFRPAYRQLIKASFTSLRFLLVIPFMATLYSKVDHFIHLEPYTVNFIEKVKTDNVWLVWTVIGYVVVSVLCALIFTFIKFGQDRVLKDGDKLIIQKGMINQSKVTIELTKISGVEVRQSFLKRLLGLAEIRLQFKSKDENDLQSIYPYFEYEQAIAFVNVHFPEFAICGKQEKLTKASLIPRLFRASILVIVLWIGCYVGREWLPIAYYWLGVGLTLMVLLGVALAYKQFCFAIDRERIQLRHGVFGSKLTILRFRNISSLEVEESMLQRWFGLRTMTVRTYTDQLVEYQLKDVRSQALHALQQGYLELRRTE